jgi:23S rRNA pseudouridine1911/1915/1917 synthase
LKWTVDPADAGTRLDKFLASPARLGSRAKAAAALERGKVFLNDTEAGLADAGTRLTAGDAVRVWMDRPGSSKARAAPREPGGLEIVFEDDSLLVLNKPAGLLAVPLARRNEAPSVYHHLEEYLRPRGKRRPHVVHRIDRDTSGLVVFAKHARAQERVKEQFRHREAERIYLAIVYGHPDPRAGTWRDHLVWDDDALIQKETHPRDPRGKEAISEYQVVEEFEAVSLIEVRLQTGKRNQIRLQARLRGHTLVGEQRYVFGPASLRPIAFPRQALHAWRLAFRHPEDGKQLRFEAPLPADMESLLARLRPPPPRLRRARRG